MSKVDNRVVHMEFDNKKFLEGAAATLDTLKNLDTTLSGMSSGPVSKVSGNVESITKKLGVMGVVGATALGKATSAAIDFGVGFTKNLFGPLIQGGKKRALSIEQATFQFEGLGMDIEQAMEDALYGVKDTAFGLDEAAVAASQFGASGVELGDDMKTALRGISGVAAMTGSTYADVSSIFTTVAGQNRLMTSDLRRLESRGINAAAVMGEAMGKSETAVRQMITNGEIDFATFSKLMDDAFGEHAIKAAETYMGSISLVSASFSRIGAAFATVKHEGMRRVFNALTPVINAVFHAIEPLVTVYRWWVTQGARFAEKTFESLVEPIRGMRDGFLWLGLAVNRFKTFTLRLLAPIGSAFKAVFGLEGGLTRLSELFVEGARKIFEFSMGLEDVAVPSSLIESIFKGIFTAIKAVGTVAGATLGIVWKVVSTLVSWLSMGFSKAWDWVNSLDSIGSAWQRFIGFFDGIDVTTFGGIREALGATVEAIGDFFSNVFSSASDRIQEFKDSFKDTSFYEKWQGIVEPLADFLTKISDGFSKFFDIIKDGGKSLGGTGAAFANLGSSIWDALGQLWGWLSAVFGPGIKNFFEMLGELTADGFEWLDFDKVLKGADLAILGTVAYYIKDMFDSFMDPLGGFLDAFSGMGESLSGTLGAITDGIANMQKESKPTMLLKIAAAIGILAVSAALLASLDTVDLVVSLGALAVITGVLGGALYGLTKIATPKDITKMSALSGALVIMAGALLILAVAVRMFAGLSWNELAVGLVGAAAGMAILVLAAWALSEIEPVKLASAAFGITLMAAAMVVMALALKTFASIDPERLGDALFSFVLTLGISALALAALGANGAQTMAGAAAVGILALAMTAMAGVISLFSVIPWNMFLEGFGKFAILLVTVSGILALMGLNGPNILAASAALLVLSIAMANLVPVVLALGLMSFDILIQGIAALAAVLVLIVAAVMGMDEALPGAAALITVAFALNMLVVPITLLGALPLPVLIAGLAGLGVALYIIVAAAKALTPVSAGLLAFGGAIALAGAGTMMLGIGITTLAAAFATNGAVIVAAIVSIVSILPLIGQKVAEMIVSFFSTFETLASSMIGGMKSLGLMLLEVLRELIPPAVRVLGQLIVELLAELEQVIPALGKVLIILIDEVLKIIVEAIPLVVVAAYQLVEGVIQGIADNIDGVVTAVANLMVEFLGALEREVPRMATAGKDLLLALLGSLAENVVEFADGAFAIVTNFLESMAEVIRERGEELRNAGLDLVFAVIEGLTGIDTSDWAENVGIFLDGLWEAIGGFLEKAYQQGKDLVNNIINGINAVPWRWPWEDKEPEISTAANPLSAFAGLHNYTYPMGTGKNTPGPWLPEEWEVRAYQATSERDRARFGTGAKAAPPVPYGVVSIKDTLTNALINTDPIMEGLLKTDMGPARHFGVIIGENVEDGFRQTLGIHSPSRVFAQLGLNVGQGLVQGLKKGLSLVVQVVQQIAIDMVEVFQRGLRSVEKIAESLKITPKMDLSTIMLAMQVLIILVQTTMMRVSGMLFPVTVGFALLSTAAGITAVSVSLLSIAFGIFATNLFNTVVPLVTVTALMGAIMTMSGTMVSVISTNLFRMSSDIVEAVTIGLRGFSSFNQGLSKALGAANRTLLREMQGMVRTLSTQLRTFSRSFSTAGATAAANASSMVRRVSNSVASGVRNMRGTMQSAGMSVGSAIANGMRIGLANGSASVSRAARNVASNALRAAKSTLGVASPSKQGIWLGEMFDEGFALGLERNSRVVETSSAGVANTALEELRKVLSEIESEFDEDGFHPTIRPVVDLTDAEAKLERFNSIFATDPITGGKLGDRSAKVAALYERNRVKKAEAVKVGENRILNYTQNNHSPKALPKAEIYRRTKNQLSTVKGAIE